MQRSSASIWSTLYKAGANMDVGSCSRGTLWKTCKLVSGWGRLCWVTYPVLSHGPLKISPKFSCCEYDIVKGPFLGTQKLDSLSYILMKWNLALPLPLLLTRLCIHKFTNSLSFPRFGLLFTKMRPVVTVPVPGGGVDWLTACMPMLDYHSASNCELVLLCVDSLQGGDSVW